jgi:tetratricopeptide (TPR) repeat protein
MVDHAPLPEEAPPSPLMRAIVAVLALVLIRWSVYGPVSMETTKEIEAREKLRALIDGSKAALREQRYEDALASLTQLTELQPKNHVYLWERAGVLRALRRPRDEVEALEAYVKVSPLPDDACPRLGFLYLEIGKKAEALDAFKRCAAFNPNSLEDQFHYGHALEREGDVDAALAVYEQALVRGSNGDVEAGRGRMLLRKGRAAAADEAVAPTLRRNPNNSDALLVAGLARLRRGKREEAKALLERGAARHDDTDFRYALGIIAELSGKRREALAHYDAAIRLDPDNEDARARRARLTRGKR